MSRWDALRSDNDRVDPTPTSLSSRRWRPPGKGSAVQHRDSSHVVQGEERNSYASSRGSVKSRRNSTNNHERRVDGKINNSSQRQQESHLAKKEEQLRDALHQLRNAASSFSTNDTNNKSVDENNLESPFQKSIDMLVHSIFGKIESASFFQGAGVNKHNFAMAESFVSQDVIWEVCHSLLKEIEFLSESNKCIKECIHFIIRISILTSACLQLLLDIHQTKSSSRPKAMSDLRLCDCASILLNILGNESNLFTDQSTIIFTDEVSCKASLFQCLAKVMAVSAINWAGNGERSPLFPWGAENAVDLVMKQSMLPFIEKLTASDDFDLTPLMKMKHCYGAIESVYLLLKDPNDGSLPDIIDGKLTNRQPQLSKHGAAILAPLVIDVLPDGKENQRFNPLRSKTLSAVGNFWNWTCEVIDSADQKFIGKFMESCMSYECLIVTLNSLYALRKAKSKSPQHCEKGLPGNTHELDASNIARQIHNMIQSEALHENRSKFLHVLTSLCLAYPGASASQWHLFLERSGSQLQSKDSSLPILLTLVENGNTSLASGKLGSKDCIILPDVLRAISVLISSMPLTLWIAGEGRVSTRLSGGNIASRVRSAVASVMPCLLNLMTSIRDNLVTMSGVYRHEKSSSPSSVEVVMVQCSLLAGQLCTRIPFSRENSVFLQPCSNLVRCAGDIYVLSAKSIERESPSPRILHKSMSIFSFVITESLGGNVTDIAQATPVSPPAHHWLSTKSSYEFIGMLLSGPLSCRDSPLFNLAKSSPWALTREPFNLASFCDLCVVHCSNENDEESRFLGVKLIESFVLGRRNFLAECISHKMDFSVVTESFCPLLLSALDDKSASVRICAVTSFGSLLQYDWQVLFTPNSNIADDLSSKDYRLIESILRMCSGHHRDKNASIRSSSCKAVGDIYTICIDCVNGESDSFVVDPLPPFTDEFAIILSSKICNVMEHALADKNAPVRSMALFAIGNVALALKERCKNSRLRSSSMTGLFPLVYACLDDKDEKVVGNAIRTIGHIAYFAYSPEYMTQNDIDDSTELKSYQELLSNLTTKVELALGDALGESSRDLTWKRRNSAKKHAWGACTALGMLLAFSNITSKIDKYVIETALSQLFRCVQLSSAINEKITSASLNSLRKLPIAFWSNISTRCDSIGRGLATCFRFLYYEESLKRTTQTHTHSEIENITNTLLISAKKNDFCIMFLMQESIQFQVEFLYQWLVSNNIDVCILDEIAAAVESQEVQNMLDISLAQMFLSRTIQQHNSPRKVNFSSLHFDDNDDEDEL